MLGTCKHYTLIFECLWLTCWNEQEANYTATAVIQERAGSALDESGRWKWIEQCYPWFRTYFQVELARLNGMEARMMTSQLPAEAHTVSSLSSHGDCYEKCSSEKQAARQASHENVPSKVWWPADGWTRRAWRFLVHGAQLTSFNWTQWYVGTG